MSGVLFVEEQRKRGLKKNEGARENNKMWKASGSRRVKIKEAARWCDAKDENKTWIDGEGGSYRAAEGGRGGDGEFSFAKEYCVK